MDHLKVHELPEGLRRPILIMAFTGWNDAAESATTAARYVATSFAAEKFAEIDPEEFYHFGLSRPNVRFKPGSETEREIIWPATEFSISQSADLTRDLIVGVAIEPHLRWKAYCEAVVDLARRSEVALVLMLGALLAEVPHTRPVRLAGSASDPELAVRLGVRPSRYEGPTGIVGVLHDACRQAGISSASLWAAVPHYVSLTPSPKAALALSDRLADLLEADIDTTELAEAAESYSEQVSEAVASDPDTAAYIEELEQRADTLAEEADLPSGDALAAELTRFLRERDERDDDDPPFASEQ